MKSIGIQDLLRRMLRPAPQAKAPPRTWSFRPMLERLEDRTTPTTVSGLSPNFGPAGGMTGVFVNGSGFTSASAVRFGATAAMMYSVVSDMQIQVFSPPEPAGVVDIVVTAPSGQSPTSSADLFTYQQPTSSTGVTSSADPSSLGQSVTFTATVSGSSGTPTGTVTFKDDATVLGTGALSSGGQATFTTSALSLGGHNITAVYGGDANFTGSTSSVFNQSVGGSITWVVVNTGDTGSGDLMGHSGDLRFCLTNARNGDGINFSIPGYGTQTINVGSSLPVITHSIAIDGWTQPGASFGAGPLIAINGGGISANGLDVEAGGVTIEGLAIYNFGLNGVLLNNPAGSASDILQGCYVGTDLAGDSSVGNGTGVLVEGANDTVGDPTGASRTVVSGNLNDGIDISGPNAGGALITHDWVGVGLTGLAPVPNRKVGVGVAAGNNVLSYSAFSGNKGNGVSVTGANNKLYDNFIGVGPNGVTPMGNGVDGVFVNGSSNSIGLATQSRNVISGNGVNGVELYGPSSNNRVANNYIGLDDNGDVQGNAQYGVLLSFNFNQGQNPTGNTIGGSTTLGQGNVISANGWSGVNITIGASANVVAGNFIGTNSDGTLTKDGNGKSTGNGAGAPGNGGDGVTITDSSSNTVGGTTVGSLNVISGNAGSGVLITGAAATKNIVEGDYIGTDKNGAKALGNGTNGVTIQTGATNNTVGALAPAQGADTTVTVISGNAIAGVAILTGCNNNQVINCYIGTDKGGTMPLGNLFYGIDLEGDTNTIGGLQGGSKNLISGNGTATWNANSGFGIFVTGAGAKNNMFQDNYIGTTWRGRTGLGNVNSGIYFLNSGTGNTVGGTAVGATNVISANGTTGAGKGGYGVEFHGSTGNTVQADIIGLASDGTPLPNVTDWLFGATGNTVTSDNRHQ